MASQSELQEYIGRTGSLEVSMNKGSLRIPVLVVDVRENWGRRDFMVEPQLGTGHAWVQETKLSLD